MLVLKIIGIIVALVITYFIVEKLNKYTMKKYKYEFVEWYSYLIVAFSYGFIYLGWLIYENALKVNGDILNGQILVGIGILGLFYMLVINIKKTNFFMGLFGTIFQFTIYLALAVVGAIVFLIVSAALSETKPVYNVN